MTTIGDAFGYVAGLPLWIVVAALVALVGFAAVSVRLGGGVMRDRAAADERYKLTGRRD